MDRAPEHSTAELSNHQVPACRKDNKGSCLPAFIRILALTINKVYHESGICRIFAPCYFITKVCIWVLTQAIQSLCPHRQYCFLNPPFQILPPQEPAQQVGGSQYSTLCKEDLGQMQGQTHNAQAKIQSLATPWPGFWHNLVYVVQTQPSRIKLCNCTPSPQFISPLCCFWVPFVHISSPCLEFKSC